MTRYVIFGRPGCPYCVQSRSALGQHGLSYEFRDLGAAEHHQELLRRCASTPGAPRAPTTVPQIFLRYPNEVPGGRPTYVYVGGSEQLLASLGGWGPTGYP